MPENAVELSGFGSAKGEFATMMNLGTAKWAVGADADYAVYVEMGTIHMAAQPYLRPAIAEVMQNQADAIAEDAAGVDDLVKRLAEAIVDEAKDRAPVATGTLRDSIHAEKRE
jgi:hypothetical protein